MTNPFFGNMPQQKGVAPSAAPSGTTSLTSDIDPIKRAKFTGYLEGMSANALPPQPPQPPMMPQPPMPMNMGGMVDVFDPMYMNQGGFVISTDKDGKIRTKPVFSEDRGRMVSQILSRDMVDDMANQAAMLKTMQSPPMEVEPESKFVGFADTPVVVDDSLKGVPDFTTTTIEPEPMISLPTPKPNLPMDIDMLRVGEDTDTSIALPKRKPIQLPVSKPNIANMLRDIDEAEELRDAAEYTSVRDIDDLGTEEREIKDIDDLGTIGKILNTGDFNRFGGGVERQGLIEKPVEGIFNEATGEYTFQPIDVFDPFADEREAASKRLSPEGLKQIARMVTEGEKLSGPEVPIFDMLNISPMGETYGEEMGEAQTGTVGIYPETPKKDLTIDDIARLILASQTEPLISSGERKDSNRIVDFLNRFVLGKRAQIGMNDGGIVQGFVAGGDVIKDMDVFERPEKTISSNISGNVGGRDDSDDDLRRDEDISFIDGKEIESTGPVYDAFLKSQESPFAPIVNKIGESVFNKSPYDLFYTTQQNLKPDSMQSRIARDRQLDRERAERKLAEEQRLRDMIAGMMPKTAATPAPPMVTAPDAPTATPATPDYSSVVVPSDRVPGFDVGKISPYPQFRMPTEFSPVFPSSLSADYFRDLFKNIGVNKMQEGGAVNQLDSAIDNFINAYR